MLEYKAATLDALTAVYLLINLGSIEHLGFGKHTSS